MFGMGRPKIEKMALKIERVERARELAYEKGQIGTAVEGERIREKVMAQVDQWLRDNPQHSDDEIEQILVQRGKIKSWHDPEYDAQMQTALLMHKSKTGQM